MYVVLVLGRLVRMVKLRTGLNNAKNSSHSGRKIDWISYLQWTA